MATKRKTQRLEGYEHRYRELARQLADIGYIASGSLAPRFTRCGKPHCAYVAEPPKLQAPIGTGAPKSTARPSTDGSTIMKRPSTASGSTTTARLASSWPRCERWRPRRPHSSSKRRPDRVTEVDWQA